jgi:hypothetical protein
LNGRRQSFHKIGSLFTFSGGRSRRKVNASQRQDLSIHGKGACIVPRASLHLNVTKKTGYGIHVVGEPSRPGQFEAAAFFGIVICIFKIAASGNQQNLVAFGSLCDVVKINRLATTTLRKSIGISLPRFCLLVHLHVTVRPMRFILFRFYRGLYILKNTLCIVSWRLALSVTS